MVPGGARADVAVTFGLKPKFGIFFNVNTAIA